MVIDAGDAGDRVGGLIHNPAPGPRPPSAGHMLPLPGQRPSSHVQSPKQSSSRLHPCYLCLKCQSPPSTPVPSHPTEQVSVPPLPGSLPDCSILTLPCSCSALVNPWSLPVSVGLSLSFSGRLLPQTGLRPTPSTSQGWGRGSQLGSPLSL